MKITIKLANKNGYKSLYTEACRRTKQEKPKEYVKEITIIQERYPMPYK